jgi:predicted Zn-dependent protease
MRLCIVLSVVAISGPAWPCGNEVEPLREVPMRDFLRAQERFEAGDYQAVLAELDDYLWPGEVVDGRFRILAAAARFRLETVGARELGQRGHAAYGACSALRWTPEAMAALDQLAADSLLPDGRGRRALRSSLATVTSSECPAAAQAEQDIRDSAQRVEDWVSALRRLRRADGNDPVLAATLAEGLSLLAGQDRVALTILSDLEARDLIPDAWGYAALARLRLRHADAAGAARAAALCRATARDAGICPAIPVG